MYCPTIGRFVEAASFSGFFMARLSFGIGGIGVPRAAKYSLRAGLASTYGRLARSSPASRASV
jgi:hypothetical protein